MHWDDLRPMLWSAVGGAVAAIVVGFAFGGWSTAGQTDTFAMAVAEDTVTDRLTPICVTQAKNDPEWDQKLANLKKTDSWQRGSAVAKFGWATMPGEEAPDSSVADSCAVSIMNGI